MSRPSSKEARRLPSYPPIDGQLDVFEVIDLVEEEGLVPDRSEAEREASDDQLQIVLEEVAEKYAGDEGIEIVRGDGYTFSVVNAAGESLHPGTTFYTQVECWAFIVGYTARRREGMF